MYFTSVLTEHFYYPGKIREKEDIKKTYDVGTA
jgi:hypothetical protein